MTILADFNMTMTVTVLLGRCHIERTE